MAFEATAIARQEVPPGGAVTFTATAIPCNLGVVKHSDGSPSFILPGGKCRKRMANYFVDFAANIAVPEGQTAGEISLSLALDGAALPASTMITTPTAAEAFFNVSRAMSVPIFSNCCQTLTVVNTSDITIAIANGNIVIDRPDLR